MTTPARSLARRAAIVVALAALPALAPTAQAQSIWLDRVDPKTIQLEIAKPSYEGDGDGFFTTSWYLGGRVPLSSSLWFVGELPFATLTIDDPFPPGSSETSSTIGNPYLGIETKPPGAAGGWMEVGVRVPLASEDEVAVLSGVATDVERWEAFFPNAFVGRVAAHWRGDIVGKPGVDVHLAPAVWVSDDFDDDVELMTTYGAHVLYHGTGARAGAGLSGRLIVTEDGDFGERSTHQFDAAADFLKGRVRPGATVRIPLDDDSFNAGLDIAFGVTLNVLLQ